MVAVDPPDDSAGASAGPFSVLSWSGSSAAAVRRAKADVSAVRRNLETAWDTFQTGDLSAAEGLLNPLPKDIEQLIGQGSQCEREKGAGAAGVPPRLELDLLFGAVQTLLGRCRECLHRQPEAVETFKKAVAAYQRTPLHVLLDDPASSVGSPVTMSDIRDFGLALQGAGPDPSAPPATILGCLEHARALGDSDPDLLLRLGLSRQERGALEEAESLLHDAAMASPQCPFRIKAWAEALAALGRTSEAAKQMNEAARMLWIDLPPESIRLFRRCVELDGGAIAYRCALAFILCTTGQEAEAREVLREVEALGSADPLVVGIKAGILGATEGPEHELPLLYAAVSQKPEWAWAWGELATVLRRLDRSDEIQSLLDGTRRDFPALPAATWAAPVRGQLLAGLGRYDEAERVLQEAAYQTPAIVHPHTAWVVWIDLLRERGKHLAAADALSGLHAVPFGRAWVAGREASVRHQSGQANEAIRLADNSLARFPDHAMLKAVKGQVLAETKEYEAAVPLLKSAIALLRIETLPDPELKGCLTCLAQAMAAGEPAGYTEALSVAEEAVSLSPRSVYARWIKADLLRRLGQNDQAVAAADKVLEIDPDNHWAWATKGESLRCLDRLPEALEALYKALDIEPDYPWAMATRGQVFRTLGRNTEAIEDLSRATRSDGSMAWAYWELAQALASLKRYPESLEAAESAIHLCADASSYATKAGLLLDAGDHLAALEAIQRALVMEEGASWLLCIKAQICFMAGEFDRAAEIADQAIRAQPPEPAAYEIKGRCIDYANHANPAEALEYLREARRLNPGDLVLRTELANVLFSCGRRDEAATVYEEIVQDARQAATTAENLHCVGWSQYRLGRNQSALQMLGESLSLDPDSPCARFDFALTLLGSGRTRRSKQEYERGLSLVRKLELLARRLPLVIALNDIIDDGLTSARVETYPDDVSRPGQGDDADRAANRSTEAAQVRLWPGFTGPRNSSYWSRSFPNPMHAGGFAN